MTAQFAEWLRYEGKEVAMCTNPICDYFALAGFQPSFESNCTALWRGYVGQWEIFDGRLYLVKLDGRLKEGTIASVATIFPDFPDRVFAHWYSGALRVPQGYLLKYKHMGYGSLYERDLLIKIARGVVQGFRVRHNGHIDHSDAPKGYVPGGFVTFPIGEGKGLDQ